LVTRLKRVGFNVHEIQVNDEIEKFIGYKIDRKKGEILPLPKRIGHLWMVLSCAIHWCYISPKFVEVILGHWMWLAQLNRSCLCIPFVAYHFISKFEHSTEPKLMWKSLRTELRCMRGALVFCKLSLVRPVVPCIGAADASGFGSDVNIAKGGVGFAFPSLDEVEHVLLSNANKGRRDIKHSSKVKVGKQLTGENVYHSASVPKEWTHSLHWHEAVAWEFRTEEHIDALELRSQVAIYEIISKLPWAVGSQFVILCDNTAACGVLGKGRAKVYRLNHLARRRFSLEAATGLQFHVCHIESKFMPMDSITRSGLPTGPLAEAVAQLLQDKEKGQQAQQSIHSPSTTA